MKKLLSLCLWLSAAAVSGAPLGTAFTYSGRLMYQNKPANGSFDLEVKLFDAANGPNQVGQTINVNGLNFVNGLFVTSLDFGGGVFNGTAYWLEISARPNGNGPYTLLSPRQPVNPSPYALYAPKADSASTASNVSVNAVGSAALQNNSVTANKIASGEVVKSLNGLFDNVTLNAGANVTITPIGNGLTIAANGTGPGWSLSGNANTTAGLNFLGTTDDEPLQLRVNGTRAMQLSYVDRIGAGGPFGTRLWGVNVLGGLDMNSIGNGVVGATISGGGSGTGSLLDPDYDANEVGSDFGTIGGGAGNIVGATYGTIGGGADNQIWSAYGTIPGGTGNFVSGIGGFAAGKDARVHHDGSFVWGDGTGLAFSGGPRRFDVRATGGAGFDCGGNNLRIAGGFLEVSGSGGEEAYFGGDGAGADVQVGSRNPSIANVALYNAGNGTWMNLLARDATVRMLTITGGMDLAEPFHMSEKNLPPGSVVIIDEAHPGQLKLSTEPYDTRVAGIISGANGINTGLSLRQEGKVDGGQNVALSGRVYVLADATNGAIKPGDLLTASATPGHAMKVTDHARAQGAVLGKAMSALSEGTGMVLVLVTLQ